MAWYLVKHSDNSAISFMERLGQVPVAGLNVYVNET
jgi:hypothetical protein